jgi:hypothetical protein
MSSPRARARSRHKKFLPWFYKLQSLKDKKRVPRRWLDFNKMKEDTKKDGRAQGMNRPNDGDDECGGVNQKQFYQGHSDYKNWICVGFLRCNICVSQIATSKTGLVL